MAREDFLDIVNILDLNDWFSLKCIFSIKFVFVTSNMITGKFENMARNHMLLIMNVKAAIFCKHCFYTACTVKRSHFTGGYKLLAVAKNLPG